MYNVSTFSTRTGGITLKFEWDEDKNELNLKKHGIDFETTIKGLSISRCPHLEYTCTG